MWDWSHRTAFLSTRCGGDGGIRVPGPRSALEWPATLPLSIFFFSHPGNSVRKRCCRLLLGATAHKSMSAKADDRTDLTRNWYEPRVESLEVTKMCFPKINHELPLINIDSFEREEKEQEREKKSWWWRNISSTFPEKKFNFLEFLLRQTKCRTF